MNLRNKPKQKLKIKRKIIIRTKIIIKKIMIKRIKKRIEIKK